MGHEALPEHKKAPCDRFVVLIVWYALFAIADIFAARQAREQPFDNVLEQCLAQNWL